MARHLSIEPHMVDGKMHLCVHVIKNDTVRFDPYVGMNLKAVFPKSPFSATPAAADIPFDAINRPVVAPVGHYPYEVWNMGPAATVMAQGQIDID